MRLVIDVQVSDLKRAVDFYTRVLGLLCRREETDWAAVAVGDAEIHLYIAGGVKEGIEFYVEDIKARVHALEQKGVRFHSAMEKEGAIRADEHHITEFPWGTMAYFYDSEGNELALVEDF